MMGSAVGTENTCRVVILHTLRYFHGVLPINYSLICKGAEIRTETHQSSTGVAVLDIRSRKLDISAKLTTGNKRKGWLGLVASLHKQCIGKVNTYRLYRNQ